ncbi:Two component regulator propeller [Reichenbachiella faecimaris]|uniref:Two component regulator propeller n=1 Tax=Reichenbachiella faecimaris TaxID=692418 RepID=A0A1W2GF92_REIFA|nr:two-component regulator propeller domain-containing protein [Reichenbachiella faecimaris]SMD35317.1 Two component regulator propeller [Reichenbachiella faecimaris]
MKQDVEIVFTKTLRMNQRANALILFFLFLTFDSYGQELIPMGTWRSHFNYEQTHLVEKTTSNVFAATAQGLMYYDPEDESVNKLTKVDGLSDVGISALAFNGEDEYLAIGYQNGNVDIITSDGIQNLPILLNSDITESKKINHISFYNGNMNLSTDFGLLVLTPENQVIEAYQNLGENGEIIAVRSSAILLDVMYLATEEGVLAGELTTGDNLQDFNNWERYKTSPVYNIDILSIAQSSGSIFAASNNTVYKFVGEQWVEITIDASLGNSLKKIRAGLTGLLVLAESDFGYIDSGFDVYHNVEVPEGAVINDILEEPKQEPHTYWYADENQGFSRFTTWPTYSDVHFTLDGPLKDVNKLKLVDGDVFSFSELDTDYNNPVSNNLGYSMFSNGEWKTIKPDEIEELSNISDAMSTKYGVLITSFGDGILNSESNEVFDFTNSPLDEREAGTGNTLVSGLAADHSDNIWIANFSVNSLLKWNGEEEWEAFDFGTSAASEPTSIRINENNQVWMSLGLTVGQGVLAYDIEADVSRYVTATTTSLPSNRVNDIAFGKDNEIWFATDLGIAYFPFSFGVIEDQTVDVSLPIFEQSILFEDKQVNALAIDGGNRMWVGTQDGLWLFEENFGSLEEHFTVDNSPLPSNSVRDLAIHPETAELFVATDQGMVSYRSEATEGTNVHYQVKIFPNPVLPEFEGLVGMSGLANNVRVKITTIAGQLVREMNAVGGGASWDVRDYTGRRVSTGVYLIFSADQEGKETFVGKIAVID